MSARAGLVLFFALALGLSWACWVPLALHADGATTPGGSALLRLGFAGPLLGAAAVLALPGQGAARARWWRRLTRLQGLASPAGLLCVLLPVLLAQLALDSYAFAGGISLPGAGAAGLPALLLPALLAGALPAELGWRGFALPAMVRGREPVLPTLLLGCITCLWQLPLYFCRGTFEAGVALASAAGFVLLLGVVGQAVLLTAFYLATRCTWAAVLFHGLTSLLGEYWQLPVAAEVHRALWTLLAAGLVLLVKPPFGIRPGPPAPPRGGTAG